MALINKLNDFASPVECNFAAGIFYRMEILVIASKQKNGNKNSDSQKIHGRVGLKFILLYI